MCDSLANHLVRPFDALRTPILASIMRDRMMSFAISAACVIQVGLFASTGHGWQCPIRGALGIPCPGCGLSHATLLLFQGKWRQSFAEHAFAPIFLIGLVLVAVVSLLPGKWRAMAVGTVSGIEKRTGITAIILVALMGYWGMRLLSAV